MALTTSLPSPPLARTKAAPARSPPHHSRHASESAITRPSPTQLTDPVVPNLGFAATPTTSPPPRHSHPSPSQPAPPRSRHHATLCGHASHPIAPTLTRVAGTHWLCRPPTKMSFLSFFSFSHSSHCFRTIVITSMSPPSPSRGHRPLLHCHNRA